MSMIPIDGNVALAIANISGITSVSYIWEQRSHDDYNGHLHCGWVMLEKHGCYYPAKFWDSELRRRCLLVCWDQPYTTHNVAEAILQWKERSAAIDSRVASKMITDEPNNHHVQKIVRDAADKMKEVQQLRAIVN